VEEEDAENDRDEERILLLHDLVDHAPLLTGRTMIPFTILELVGQREARKQNMNKSNALS
jgi:hypothetical protein